MSKTKTLKIIHIHSNYTFILDSINFENNNFNNEFIFIGKKNNYNGIYSSLIKYFDHNPTDLKAVVEICDKADVIVLYNLDFVKSYIANRVKENVKVCWRFFGEELYSKITKIVLSEISMQNFDYKNQISFQKLIIKTLNIFRWGTTKSIEFNKSLIRINYFLCLALDEYNYLNRIFINLPEFIQLPYSIIRENYDINIDKHKKIIIGNNRGIYNNHFEVLDIISKYSNTEKFEFILLFNYGIKSNYSEKVLKDALLIKNMTILNDFLSYNDFQKIYENVGAIVINGFRQMAMGNILTALCNGVKVYLNEKNVMFNWFKNEGFLVFNIEDFENHLRTDKLLLTKDEIEFNLLSINKLRLKYNVEDFHKKILELTVN